MAESTFVERLEGEIDEFSTEYSVPHWFADNLKDDFKKAFTAWGEFPAGYDKAGLPLRFNLIDPVGSLVGIKKDLKDAAVGPLFETKELVQGLEGRTLARLSDTWADPQGAPLLSGSLGRAFNVWRAAGYERSARLKKEEILRGSPGLGLMMAQRLNEYYTAAGVPSVVAGGALSDFIEGARWAERSAAVVLVNKKAYVPERGAVTTQAGKRVAEIEIDGEKRRFDVVGLELGISPRLAMAEAFAKQGNFENADRLWKEAQAIHDVWKGQRGDQQTEVIKEFERQMKLNPQLPDGTYFANTPEAQLWRYYNIRNLYFYRTLNFFRTWRKDGLKGVAKEYVWDWVWNEKRLGKWYPPNLIKAAIQKTAGKALRPVLTKLTNLRGKIRLFRKKLQDKITEVVWEKGLKKAAVWLIKKLGLSKLGAAIGGVIGSVAPGVGNAVGAVIGAVGSFLLEVVIDKLGGILKIALAVVLGTVSTAIAFVATGAVVVIMAIALIFNPKVAFPGEAGPGFAVAPSEVAVAKEACEGSGCANFEPFLKLPLKEGAYQVHWRITLTNTSGEEHFGTFSDENCSLAEVPYELGSNGTEEFFCEQTIQGGEDKLITNSVSGTVVGDSPFRGIGIVMVGTPDACIVSGVQYYCQCGRSYSDVACKEGQNRTVCSFGCGPASEAMLINYHCGRNVTSPGGLAQDYGCGALTHGASADILGGNLSTGSFGDGDAFFAAIYEKLCEGRPVITTISHPEISVGHISLIVGVNMLERKVYLNDSYVPCCLDGLGGYAEYGFDTYRRWVNTDNFWYWGGVLHPACSQ